MQKFLQKISNSMEIRIFFSSIIFSLTILIIERIIGIGADYHPDSTYYLNYNDYAKHFRVGLFYHDIVYFFNSNVSALLTLNVIAFSLTNLVLYSVLKKVYLTNDTPEHRTSMSMDKTKDAKFSVRLVVYLTADGLADLGINDSDLNSLQPAPGPSPAPNPSPNPAPSPAPSPSPNPNPAPNPAPNPNPPTPPVDASCYKGDPRICRIEKLIADQTNTYRQSRGLGALEYDAKLAFVSRDWSQKQSQSGSISHNGFPSARQAVYSREFGANVFMTGENVAYNYCSRQGEDGAARAFSDQWWNSPGHRANMLGRHRAIGVGVVIDSRGRCYGTQIFR
jgi:uncharacterized protein YkwD